MSFRLRIPTLLAATLCAVVALLAATGYRAPRASAPTMSAEAVDTGVPAARSLDAAHRDSLLSGEKRPESDTLAAPADTLGRRKQPLPLAADSLAADSLAIDSLPPRSAGIDAPIKFSAQDSMIYDASTGLAHLFGNAEVDYLDMELTAAEICMNMDSSLVHAVGARDTSGTLTGAPIYRQGADQYDSEAMSFNFKTKKGFIRNVKTVQGNGYLHGAESKRDAEGTVYLTHAKYTTCDADHPHFYIALTRAKVKPGKEAIFGPAYPVVEDVPLPLPIPYGFIPFNKRYSSGLVMPSYGDETSRGFYLRNGGYYWAASDRFDLKVLGEIYTKGSWGLSGETNYAKRYKFRGNFYVSYLNTVEGEKNMPDYSVTKSLKVQWSHTKDAKAAPNTSFSARVNFASQSYERKNLSSMYNPVSYTQSTRTSSVSFSQTFPSIGFTISASANLSQNLRDSTVSVTLPDLSLSLARFYPFRRKRAAGKERWYEKISLSYTGSLSNSITTKEDRLLKSNLVKDWRNGFQHRIPVDATFQLFKYINISPAFSFRDIMYASRIDRSWDDERRQERRDTTYGFYNLYDWSTSVSMNTTLYGFFTPVTKIMKKKIIAVRHVFKPSVSFSYSPDFTAARYGYQKSYTYTDENGEARTVTYSPYAGGLYGYPSGSMSGMVTMSVSNNVEMKVRSSRDSTGERKISLIDELSGNLSYNFAAKTRPWSDLSTRIRLKLAPKYTLSLAAVFATYAYAFNDRGQVVRSDRTEWSYGRFGRFQGMSQNLSYTFDNQTFGKLLNLLRGRGRRSGETENNGETDDTDELDANLDPDLKNSQRGPKQKSTEKARTDADGYMAFSLPWSVTVSYGVSMREDTRRAIDVRRMRYPFSFTQTLNFSGFLRISDGWNITFSSGYDFEMRKISMTTASLARDLHCFEMSCSMVLRPYTSFNFTFRARASELADALKWEKRSSYSTNIQWY